MIYAFFFLAVLGCILSFISLRLARSFKIEAANIKELCELIASPQRAGRGLSFVAQKRVLGKAFRYLRSQQREKLYGFEKWIVDHYYEWNKELSGLSKWRRLPSVSGYPRVYVIAEFFVKHGLDGDTQTIIQGLKEIQKNVELDFAELRAFSGAIRVAECVKAAEAAEKSLRYVKEKQEAKTEKTLSKLKEYPKEREITPV